jgi:putative transposase
LEAIEAGEVMDKLCATTLRANGFYKRRAKHGGMNVLLMRRIRELEGEIRRLERMYAKTSVSHDRLKETLEKSCAAALSLSIIGSKTKTTG